MAEQQRFGGKVALVTGGASGIGRACAQLFAREGASVVVSDVAVEGGEQTVRLVEEEEEDGGEASFVEADVSKAEEVEALVGRTLEAYGLLDCAFNNAGIRVNAVCPGLIRTPMVERYSGGDAEIEAQFATVVPVGRMGTPEEVSEAVVWLCSEAASFVTGHAMAVDRGYVAR